MWLVLRVKRCVKVCYKNGICWNWLRLICYSHHNNVNNTRPEDFPPQPIRSALSPISHHPRSTENPEATVKSNKTLCPETEKNSQCQSKGTLHNGKMFALDLILFSRLFPPQCTFIIFEWFCRTFHFILLPPLLLRLFCIL